MLKIPWVYPPATAASLKALPKPSLANQVTAMFPVLLHHSKTREMALYPKAEQEAAEASQGATKAAGATLGSLPCRAQDKPSLQPSHAGLPASTVAAVGEQAAGELHPGSTTQLKLLVLVVVQPRSD